MLSCILLGGLYCVTAAVHCSWLWLVALACVRLCSPAHTLPHTQVNSLQEQVAQAQAREAVQASPSKQPSPQAKQEQDAADEAAEASPGQLPRSSVSPGTDDMERLLAESARKQQELAGKVSVLQKQCTELSSRLSESERKGDLRVRRSSMACVPCCLTCCQARHVKHTARDDDAPIVV